MPGSFLACADSWVVGTPLAVRETPGASDYLILAVFGASNSLPWPTDSDIRGRFRIARRGLSQALCFEPHEIAFHAINSRVGPHG